MGNRIATLFCNECGQTIGIFNVSNAILNQHIYDFEKCKHWTCAMMPNDASTERLYIIATCKCGYGWQQKLILDKAEELNSKEIICEYCQSILLIDYRKKKLDRFTKSMNTKFTKLNTAY